jgi:hypothetical protein
VAIFVLKHCKWKGFSPKWISWVESFVSGGSVAINVNGMSDIFSKPKKVLGQGDSLSPLLFNIDTDMLAILIN